MLLNLTSPLLLIRTNLHYICGSHSISTGQHWFRPLTSLPALRSYNQFVSCYENHRERRSATGLTILHTLAGFFRNSGPNCSLPRTFLRVVFAACNLAKWGNVSPRQRAGLFPFTVKAIAFPAQRSPPVTWTTAWPGVRRGHLCRPRGQGEPVGRRRSATTFAVSNGVPFSDPKSLVSCQHPRNSNRRV